MKNRTRTAQARRLRRDSTDAERVIWRHLRNRQLADAKFRRQQPVGPYIVDFLCAKHNLVVELDGGQHDLRREHDRTRDAFLKDQGYRVVRFWNHDALARTDAALETIRQAVESASQTSPSP